MQKETTAKQKIICCFAVVFSCLFVFIDVYLCLFFEMMFICIYLCLFMFKRIISDQVTFLALLQEFLKETLFKFFHVCAVFSAIGVIMHL